MGNLVVGALGQIFSHVAMMWERRAVRKQPKRQLASRPSQFRVEPLEPRLLLSVDVLPFAVPSVSSPLVPETQPEILTLEAVTPLAHEAADRLAAFGFKPD